MEADWQYLATVLNLSCIFPGVDGIFLTVIGNPSLPSKWKFSKELLILFERQLKSANVAVRMALSNGQCETAVIIRWMTINSCSMGRIHMLELYPDLIVIHLHRLILNFTWKWLTHSSWSAKSLLVYSFGDWTGPAVRVNYIGLHQTAPVGNRGPFKSSARPSIHISNAIS